VGQRKGEMVMSELKAINLKSMGCYNINEPIYLKSEVDKKIEYLMSQLELARTSLIKLLAKAQHEARHQKYKRCMAMAAMCAKEVESLEGLVYDVEGAFEKYTLYKKRHKRWLELAKKFKLRN
jgi:hypothetical protein